MVRWLGAVSFKIFSKLDNNNNCDFRTNGERRFVEDLLRYIVRSEPEWVVFFDIGANVGEYTKMLLEKCADLQITAEIHVFEPTRSCFEIMVTKFGNSDHIFLNQKAVSNSTGTVEIYYDSEKSGLASLYKRNLDAYSIEMNHSEIVETIRLDSYIEMRKIKHIHYLKLDIEGHEKVGLEGLGKYLNGDFIDFIQFEYGGTYLDSHTSLMDVYSLFNKAGFVIAKVMRNGLEIRSYKQELDQFQYANYVAISEKVLKKQKI